MYLSWKKVQFKHSLKHINFSKYFRHIGLPFYEILKLIGIKKNYEAIRKTYQRESLKQNHNINYFTNTVETIKKLKSENFILNIVTSKDIKRTKIFLKDISKYFTFIECNNDKIKGKPYPDQINLIVHKLNAKKKDCVYIGDTNVDFITAKNANVEFIFAKWGYGYNYNYKYKLEKIEDLLKKIKTTF